MHSRRITLARRILQRLRYHAGATIGPHATSMYGKTFPFASRYVSASSTEARAAGIHFEVLGSSTPPFASTPITHPSDSLSKSLAEFLSRDAPSWCFGDYGLLRYPEARFHFPTGVHVSGNLVCKEGYLSDRWYANPSYRYRTDLIRFKKAKSLPPGILFLTVWNHNFYHYFLEMLPRLQLLEASNVDPGMPLYVPRSASGFVRESLELLGVADRAVWLDDGVFSVSDLIVPSRLAHSLYPCATAVDWLRANLGTVQNGQPSRRIYISRSDATIRFLTNEDEVMAMLGPLGFEKVIMSKLSLSEQIALASSANAIVAPHGAALSHLAFLRDRGAVIELCEPGHNPGCYARLSRIRGAFYGCMVGERDGLGFKINPQSLQPIVEKMITHIN